MKTKTTVFCAVLFTALFQANAWSQWGGNGYGSLDMPASAKWRSSPMPFSDAMVQNGKVVPASYCGDAFGPGGGLPAASCSGACGGSCGGGCGMGGGGFLKGALGGALGLGNGLAGGALGGGGWLDVEYLLWWNKERHIPALATTSPTGTPSNVAGHLGQPTTSILFGNDLIGGGPYSGVRVSTGRWLDAQQTLGIGGRFFTVGGEDDFSRTSNGDPILARPFFDTTLNSENALLVAYPGISHGSINIVAENRATGFDIFFRKLMLSGYCNRLDLIGGYHNSTVTDSVEIGNSVINDDANRAPVGAQVDTRDYFEVKNQFNGGFVGIMGTSEDGPLSWNMLAKVAFGNMNQEASVRGSTASSVPGAGSFTNDFGLLAVPTNMGTFDRDQFAVVPEVNINVGYNVTNNFKVLVGYTFIYWSKVGLAGDLIDTTVNTTQLSGSLVGDARPRSQITSDGFWYSGLSIGGSMRF